MINKILIANRGEIAVRIIRACNEMGIQTVAVHSDVDKDALHVEMADERVCIGGGKALESYLNMNNIISAAFLKKADAIHPGFGFLSENPTFVSMCEDCNIQFIGPSSEIIELMGNKSKARELMKKAGVPVVPGSDGNINTVEEIKAFVKTHGYPVMIKASAGGGGRGIRIIHQESEIENQWNAAKQEAKLAFGDSSVYLEKMILDARHIEVQILGDQAGNYIHLGERDCSMQRRSQKILEESPAVGISPILRKKLGEEGVKAAKAVGYHSAGTVEFLFDKNENFYFIEMNTRIQVEHPVTEMVSGIDLIKEQIKIAEGKKLSYVQNDINLQGHAIECRINAENTHKNFTPSPGTIKYLFTPGGRGVRIDSGIYPGYTIPHLYDSMIAKLIVHGKDREEAISIMKRALMEYIIEGVETNIDFHLEILDNKDFLKGNFHTNFINQYIENKNK